MDGQQWASVIGAVSLLITSLGSLAASLRNSRKLRIIHGQLNSRLDQLLAELKSATEARNEAVVRLATAVEELRQLKGN